MYIAVTTGCMFFVFVLFVFVCFLAHWCLGGGMLGVTPLRSLEHRPSLVVVCDVFARVHCDQCWLNTPIAPFLYKTPSSLLSQGHD